MGSLVAELAEKLSSATNNFDIDEGTIYVNTSADTVGIGTTSPASKLDVQGTMQVGVNDTGHDVKFFGATAGKYMEWDESADQLDVTGSFDVTGNSTMIGTLTVGVDDTGHDVIFYGASAGAMMMWDESENLLIVRGASADHATTSAGRIILESNQAAIEDGDRIGQIDFRASGETGADALLVGASIYAESDSSFGATDNQTELVFATGGSELAYEKMRLTFDGKVGIGTSTPSQYLEVLNTAQITGAEGTSASLYLVADQGDDNGDGWRINSNQDANDLTISNNTSGSYVDKVTFLTNGRVGIGISSPGFQLDLQNGGGDGIRVAGYSTTAGDAGRLYLAHSNNGTGGTQTAVDAEDILGQIIFQGSNGSAFVSGATIKAVADETFSGTAQGSYLSFFTVDNTTTTEDERMRIDHNGRVGIGNDAPTNELTIGPTTPGADVGNAIEMRGSAGDSSLQRFQIYNNGASGKTEFKLGRSGNSPTTLLGIGPDEIEFTLPFIQTIATHQKIRQFYYSSSMANGATVDLFRNTDAYTDINGLMWLEALHSGRTHRTYIFTLGGYGFNHTSGGDGGFTLQANSGGYPSATNALQLSNGTGYTATVHIAGLLLGDANVTNISATIYD